MRVVIVQTNICIELLLKMEFPISLHFPLPKIIQKGVKYYLEKMEFNTQFFLIEIFLLQVSELRNSFIVILHIFFRENEKNTLEHYCSIKIIKYIRKSPSSSETIKCRYSNHFSWNVFLEDDWIFKGFQWLHFFQGNKILKYQE